MLRSRDDAIDVCVHVQLIDEPTGGANQFLRALIDELSRLGHRVTTRPETATQVVLVNGFNSACGNSCAPEKSSSSGSPVAST